MGTIFSKIGEIKNINKFALLLIITLALFLRVYKISESPPSLNWDEISHGYNAYSLLKTGSDEWGNFPILNFRAYGDYPLPLNLYLTTPFIYLFGLNDLPIRLPHIILGSLLVLPVYFLAYGLTKKKEISLLASFLSAITPWYVFPSRFVVQSNLSVFFLTSSLALFFNREKNKYLLPLSIISFILTLFSYHTTRIFSPLVLIVLVALYKNELFEELKNKKRAFLLYFCLAVFVFSFSAVILTSQSKARSKWVFIINEGSIGQIIEKRQTSNLPNVIKRFLYNRPTFFIGEFSKNYLDYFSPKFLFFEGGTNYQLSVPGKGLIYPINLPFFYIGLVVVTYLAVKRKKEYLFIILYLLFAPIPAAITTERYAVIRSTTLLPFTEIVISLGLFWTVAKINRITKSNKLNIVVIGIYLFMLLFGTNAYLKYYFGDYTKYYSWVWQYGYKQAVEFTKGNYSNYDKIIITKKYGEPHEYFLFYWPWDPQKYKSDLSLIRFFQSDWYWVDRFDKFYFVNDWDVPREEWQPFILESKKEEIDCRNIKCLLITSPGNVPKTWNKIKTINFLDGKPAFEIYEN